MIYFLKFCPNSKKVLCEKKIQFSQVSLNCRNLINLTRHSNGMQATTLLVTAGAGDFQYNLPIFVFYIALNTLPQGSKWKKFRSHGTAMPIFH